MTPDSKLIDGKAFAAGLSAQLKTRVAEVAAAHGFTPGLAVVIVGEDPASQIYVKNKGEQTLAAGMRSYTHRLPADTTQAALLALIAKMNADNDIDGILVQLPLPGHIDAQSVIGAIDPDKDVDGFHVVNAGRLATGGQGLVPCTPLGCILLLKDRLGDLSGLEAVVVGRSNIVGRPLAQLLIDQNCTVTLAHSRTKNLAEVCRRGDILIGAVGRPLMLGPEHVKPGAVVIDVGINRIPSSDPEKAAAGKTRVVGDVDFEAVLGQVQAITPVPGGVGPMTIAVLLRNTLQAALQRRGLKLAL